MAGWIKELLLDYGLNRLSIDQRSDISTAINGLISAGVFKSKDIEILHSYISGYTAKEIAEKLTTTTDIIEERLVRVLRAIEAASGYTDMSFIRKANRRHSDSKIADLSLFLLKHGQRFHTHDTPNKQ